MMEPKEVEWMVNRTTLRWSCRFWFDAGKVPFDFCLSKVNEWTHGFNADKQGVDLAQILQSIRGHFTESSGLTACEVLDPKKNGAVLYFVWP